MRERSLTIWKLLVGFTLFSLIAGGFKLFPMNKRYEQILVKSSSLKFGTDKALEDVIEYLEKRLEERSYYQFVMEKQPMRLTNVLTLADGSGPGSRRSRSALRVAMIYQSQEKYQAQLNYRGKVYTVVAGDSVPNIGDVVLIDKDQVIMERDSKLLSYPAPGTNRENAQEVKINNATTDKI